MSGKLRLRSNAKNEYTLISNDFIDHYMPQANGSYVKVYLYLLRLLSTGAPDSTLAAVADYLDETEKDIERALKYWEKQQLIRLTRDSSHSISAIDFYEPEPVTAPILLPVTPEQADTKPMEDIPAESADTTVNGLAAAVESNPAAVRPVSEKSYIRQSLFEKPNYSDAQVAQLTSLDEVQHILTTVERMLERLLKPADVQFVLYLYESIGFSAELIIFLYEYCASKNKKSSSYIETVAISWAEEGIDTVKKAEASTAAYNTNYNAVNRAFGLNRAPGSIEKQYMHRWFYTYGFDIPIIEEACNRTILAVTKPDFKYADKILERWHKAGVKRREDIAALDAEFAKKNAAKEAGKAAADNMHSGSANNRFNAFPQRKYTASDYSSMEERLLNK